MLGLAQSVLAADGASVLVSGFVVPDGSDEVVWFVITRMPASDHVSHGDGMSTLPFLAVLDRPVKGHTNKVTSVATPVDPLHGNAREMDLIASNWPFLEVAEIIGPSFAHDRGLSKKSCSLAFGM